MQLDNPASRLKAILEIGQGIPQDKSAKAAWHQVLETGGDLNLLIHRLGLVQQLPQETFAALELHFPSQVALAVHWRDPISAGFFNHHLAGNWATFMGHIPTHVVALLVGVETNLSFKLGHSARSPDDLAKVIELLKELAAVIDSSTFNGRLRVHLANEVAALLREARDYKFSGLEPIRRRSEALVGHAVIDPEYQALLKEDPVGKKVLETLTAVDSLLSISVNAVPLGQAAVAYFLK
jgi:hypothetical protein